MVIKTPLKYLICAGHAIVLMLFSWYWLNLPYTYGDEKKLIQYSVIFKRLMLNIDSDRPAKDKITFINVAHDLALAPRSTDNGKQVITDRQMLAEFLTWLNRYQAHRYIVLDVFLDQRFDDTEDLSQTDRQLDEALARSTKIIASTHVEDNELITPAFAVKHGLSDYHAPDGSFIKFPLFFHDSLKSLPLLMYEELYAKEMIKKNAFCWQGHRLSLNYCTIDLKIRNTHISDTNFYPILPLNEILFLKSLSEEDDSATYAQFIQDRIVVIGDFERNDNHETVLGNIAGPLILLNTFLTLESGDNLISFWLIALVFITYSVLSYLTFFGKRDYRQPLLIKIFGERVWRFIHIYVKSLFWLVLLSLSTFFLFHIHLNILVVALYLNFAEYLMNHRDKIKSYGSKIFGKVA